MPAVRLSSRRVSAVGRRRSSLATTAFAKPGTYGYTSPPVSPPLTFAPNVTPISYSAPSPSPSPFGSPSLTTDQPLPLFPPSATPAPPPTRRRVPPGKRRSQGYIPRPPNAFMLFRADFVRQKHVPGSIETNHGSLSKIIGNCWRSLPLPEKHIWETKAKHAKAEHKLKYPDYKFRPVHNKRGPAPAASTSAPPSQPVSRSASATTVKGQLTPLEDERRCEEVAALLLQGKKGEELAWAVRDLDSRRRAELAQSSPSPPYHHNSKFPSPLNLDPMYYPHVPASPPSSALTSSQASGSGAGSPYAGHLALDQTRDQTWRHRRSSSVPLPNDYSYTFPPFMYGESDGMGITLPPIGFPPQQQQQHFNGFTLPPPPSSGSLAGPQVSISGNAPRMSFSWPGSGSSFSYPRPSFSFGAVSGARGSFSFAGAFGGPWGSNSNGPVGRRASSAQAYFSPSSFAGYAASQHQQQQQQGEEELPDADTSLFDSGFLNSFGAAAGSPTASSPVNDPVSPFDAQHQQQQQQTLHAPQPVHAMSPLAVELQQQQQGQQYEHGAEQQYPEQMEQHYLDDDAFADTLGYPSSEHSTPGSSYVEADVAAPSYVDDGSEPQQHTEEAQQQEQSHKELEYPPFEFPTEEPLGFASSIDMSPPVSASYDMNMSYADSYASEFV